MIDIQSLLQEFDDVIIQRGEAYYRDGNVTDLQEVASGEYQAVVEGSEDYDVSIVLHGDDDCSFDCDCPYWNAPYCKHVVAVLLAIEEQQKQSKDNASFLPSGKSAPSHSLSLADLSKEQLAKLLEDLMDTYPETEDWLRARLSPPSDALQAYCRLIRQSAAPYSKRHYIEYRDMPKALLGAENALEYLSGMIDLADITQTVDFCVMVIRETMSIMDDGDDSNGQAGGIIEECLAELDSLFHQRVQTADNQVREKYFDQLLRVAQSDLFDGWPNWNDRIIDQCSLLADLVPPFQEQLLQYQRHMLEKAQAEQGYAQSYAMETAQKKYYHMLTRWRGNSEAAAYVSAHMDNDFFRTSIIEACLQEKQYDKAIALCLEAEQADDSHRYSSYKWQEYRYHIYKQTGDVEAQKKLAETLLLSGHDKFYDDLRSLYASEQWPSKREELLDKLNSPYPNLYLNIITKESDKPRLMAHLRQTPESIFALYTYLLPDYDDEIREIFLSALRTNASHALDRKAYHNVCLKICLFKEAFGQEPTLAIIREFQRDYPRRRAFQDELEKCFTTVRKK